MGTVFMNSENSKTSDPHKLLLSYAVSDIQDYFEYTIKKHVTVTNNPSITIYINKIENRNTFKIKT